MIRQQLPGCLYEQHENGIHHFTLTEATKFAIDCWITTVARSYESIAPDSTLRILLDIQVDHLPFNHFTHAVRMLSANYPDHPITRTAILHGENFQLSLIRSTMNSATTQLNGRDRVKVYLNTQREDALTWLLQEEAIRV